MGELSRRDAEEKRNEYMDKLRQIKQSIREEFEEMDFLNADQRNKMASYIENIEKEYELLTENLNVMVFE